MSRQFPLAITLAPALAAVALCAVQLAPAYGQDTYRETLLALGLPGLTEEVVDALAAQGIPQEGLAETQLVVMTEPPAVLEDDGESGGDASPVSLPAIAHQFRVQLATQPRQQTIGLMMRPFMADDEGMLFIFDDERPQSFWMRNTIIPLDIIYIDADGAVVSIVQGQPFDTTPLPSGAPAQFVLEVNAGTAKRLGIEPGDMVSWD